MESLQTALVRIVCDWYVISQASLISAFSCGFLVACEYFRSFNFDTFGSQWKVAWRVVPNFTCYKLFSLPTSYYLPYFLQDLNWQIRFASLIDWAMLSSNITSPDSSGEQNIWMNIFLSLSSTCVKKKKVPNVLQELDYLYPDSLPF